MAVDSKRPEVLHTYDDEETFMLLTSAPDEVIGKACSDVVSFLQSSAMTEQIYSKVLSDKALHCKTVFSNKRWKSFFTDELLPGASPQTRQFFFVNSWLDLYTVL